jgi:hypothetical protein
VSGRATESHHEKKRQDAANEAVRETRCSLCGLGLSVSRSLASLWWRRCSAATRPPERLTAALQHPSDRVSQALWVGSDWSGVPFIVLNSRATPRGTHTRYSLATQRETQREKPAG